MPMIGLWRNWLLTFLCLVASPSLAQAQAPTAPAPTVPPLEAYGDLPGIEDMAIPPSGKGLAVVGQVAGQRRLIVLDSEMKVRTQMSIGDTKLRYVVWAGEDVVLASVTATQSLGIGFTADKFEFEGIHIVPLNGTKPGFVFGQTPSLARSVFGSFGTRLIDGKWFGHYSGIELVRATGSYGEYVFDHGRPALFRVELPVNSARMVARAATEGHWRSWLVDGAGNASVILDITSDTGKWAIYSEQGATLAQGVDKSGDVGLVAFGKDGTSVIYSLEDDAAEKIRWFEVPLTGGAAVDFLSDVSIKRTYIDPTNGRILGYLTDEAPTKPVLFDPAKQAILTRVYRAFPKLDVQIIQWTPSMSHFLVRTLGNGNSGIWYVVDVAGRKAEEVGIERPRIRAGQVGPISTVAYKATDGTDLDGILTVPPGREAKNLPLVVFPHGGPHSHDTATFDWWAQAFASRGYAVFQPNFRGSTNRDQAFVRAGYGQWGRKMQTDISDGLAELVKQGIADPRRACIMGASYGGYAALAGVTLQQGLYRCAVSVAGVSDLNSMYLTDYRESGENKMVRRNLLESLGDPKTFNEVSPRRNAARADAPVLLIHGKDDTVVAFNQSQNMANALRDAGKPHELITLREEDHWLSRAATRKQMLQEAMRFVQQHNPAD